MTSCSSAEAWGAKVTAGQQIGEVESTKTTSTIYTPVSGTISKVNSDLKDHPEAVSDTDPYGKGMDGRHRPRKQRGGRWSDDRGAV
ncbi:MAG: glycine cleavage system protein H [Nitrospiraceae bacterium]